MPKAPRIRKSKGNKCNYCYNHRKPDDPIVMAKRHGRCSYNNEEHFRKCKKCLKNRGNTTRMEEYRKNEPTKYEIIEVLVLRPEEEQLKEADVAEQEISAAPTNSQIDPVILPPNHCDSEDLTLATFPQNFPKYFFNVENVKVFRKIIEQVILEMPETEQIPKFKSAFYEAGFWKVMCHDEYSKDWFVENAPKYVTLEFIDNVQQTLQVKPINDLPKYIFAIQMSGDILEDYQILQYFARYNRDIELDTSSWNNLECIPNDDGFVLCPEIDPISFEKIKENKFELSFGMERVFVQTIKE